MISQINTSLIDYILHLADSNLILAQRNAEWCGHGPILEQDIAITNISLDLIGQSRNFYQYAATLIGGDATEDSQTAIGDKLFYVSFFQYLSISFVRKIAKSQRRTNSCYRS